MEITVEKILENPKLYLSWDRTSKRSPQWNGCLLSWLIGQLIHPNHIHLIKTVRIHQTNSSINERYLYYPFIMKDWLFSTCMKYDRIEAFKRLCIDRFEMSDGGFYSYCDGDGEYTDCRLEYHDPISPEINLEKLPISTLFYVEKSD